MAGRRLPHPVISVGNLTVGGTGKTPFVAFLARLLQRSGYQPVILSRGYRGKFEHSSLLVSDGARILCGPADCGDEPYLLAQQLSGVPILVGKNRYRTGRSLAGSFDRIIYLLDDGYQHLQLRRDLDILLIDASDPFGNGRLVPAGRLREPLAAIERADQIALTRSHLKDDLGKLMSTIREKNPTAPLFLFHHEAGAFVDLKSGERFNAGQFAGKSVIALAAVGNPQVFLQDLQGLGMRIIDHFLFRDHHFYSQAQLDQVIKSRQENGAQAIVTTAKDAVRLERLLFEQGQIFTMEIETKTPDVQLYQSHLLTLIENMS